MSNLFPLFWLLRFYGYICGKILIMDAILDFLGAVISFIFAWSLFIGIILMLINMISTIFTKNGFGIFEN